MFVVGIIKISLKFEWKLISKYRSDPDADNDGILNDPDNCQLV